MADAPQPVRAHFEAFMAAGTAADILDAFGKLAGAADASSGEDAGHSYERLRDAVLPHLPYKHKGLFEGLDARFARYAALRAQTPPDARPLLVSGAGPCGLRAAVDARLLGISCTLVELRTDFSRHNVLKAWQGSLDDLAGLGLAASVPGFRRHGVLHCPTKDLQATLLRAALLLGADVKMGWGVCGLLDPSFVVDGAEGEAGRAGSWRAWALPEKLAREYLRPPDSADSADEPAELALKPGEQDTSRLQQTSLVDFVEVPAPDPKAILRGPDGGLGDGDRERGLLVDPLRSGHGVQLPLVIPFDSLVIAEGEASRLIRRLGFSRKVNKFANAIGIVVNLDFSPGAGPTSPERRIPERVVWRASADWRSSVLGPLADAGFHAENLEYLRGAAAHFIAATTRILDLLTAGIVRADRGRVRDTLRGDNVDLDALRELARKLARALGIPDDAPLSAKHGVQVFDFSARGLCTEVARVLEADGGPDALVLPAGDTMQNPYWPQGLGINRGFHNALDAVWTAYLRLLAHPPSPPLDERRDAFRTADYLTFSPACLAPAAGWTADPCSRYAQAVYARRHLDDVAAGRPPGVLPRIREALGLREAAVAANG